jgi:hypothetical protein
LAFPGFPMYERRRLSFRRYSSARPKSIEG